jgi:hypothetical protein
MRPTIRSLLAISILLATACGRTEKAGTTQARGVYGQSFSVQIFPPVGGTVKSVSPDSSIDCGVQPGATSCVASFPWAASVKLTAVAQAGYQFELWAADCQGVDYCVLDTSRYGADKYVVAAFAPASDPPMHPNFSLPTAHGPAYVNGAYPCTSCHGANLLGQGIAPSCTSCHAFPLDHLTVAGTACSSCHADIAAEWSSSADLHAASATDVLLNVDHDTNELLVDECLQCHTMFQRPLGIATFVTPIDQVGPWSLLPGASAWQATKCEVCHDPASSKPAKIAKYGAILDRAFDASYVDLSAAATQQAYPDLTWLVAPYQYVLGAAGYVQTAIVPGANGAVGLEANKLCSSCHDPDDQGGDPNVVIGTIDYGPQGGDSRAYMTASHGGLTCIDCHPTHDFTPVDPDTKRACGTSGCHDVSRVGTVPGVVHTNHLP